MSQKTSSKFIITLISDKMIYGKYNNGSSDIVFAYYGEVLTIVTYQDWEMSVKVRKLLSDNHAVLFPADVGTLSAGNTDI